jgi:rhamnose utilization protein RhaD (predicted bifunctional aldolase and dehydrogenase)/NAD(P)-dependent dehydrogenase (short-subunit alcohol dehydrogenase family)
MRLPVEFRFASGSMRRMKSLWNDAEAREFAAQGELGSRLYTSRLLGREPQLVLHGGGNTSVKVREQTFFGDDEELIYVKGSGWDLAAIEPAGFSPTRLAPLWRLAKRESLTDLEMVTQMRVAMTDPGAPTPSIEAILHAVLPARFVDHTHANAVIALTNNPHGAERVKSVYGERVLVVPYIMPGFILAKAVAELIRGQDLSKIEGLILMHHGIFSWGSTAQESYERMIKLVSEAEAAIPSFQLATGKAQEHLVGLAALRKKIASVRGQAVVARLDASPEAVGFSNLPNAASLATRGPLTPDHSIRTKRIPVVIGNEMAAAVDDYVEEYGRYFQRNSDGSQVKLQPAPNWAVWPGRGIVAFGSSIKDASIIADIAHHTFRTIQAAETLGGWQALPEKDIFAVEYWDLEQAKLKTSNLKPTLTGKIALVTGAAAGIGLQCAKVLHESGACVVGLDINPEIESCLSGDDQLGLVVDLTDIEATRRAVEQTVRQFGGLDILVSNAGIFTAGAYIADLDDANWSKSLLLNLTSHMQLLRCCIPYLKEGIDPTAIIVGSRNVRAPGAGAASYSCAKAGLTQLVRVAALELAPHNVRVNAVHPDAVFDTRLWTPEALQRSAERYGLTVEQYKKRNLMKCEITSRDVGLMVAAMAGNAFFKTTGAQIPVDGGNDRTI